MTYWEGFWILLFAQLICYGYTSIDTTVYYGGGRINPKPTYMIVAPKQIRPTEIMRVIITVNDISGESVNLRAIIKRNDMEVISTSSHYTRHTTKTLEMMIPEHAKPGEYMLRVEASYPGGGYAFFNETKLEFDPKYISVFIQTDKWLYQKKQSVSFRVIALDQRMVPVKSGSVNIYIKDPKERTHRRWLQKQLYNGYCEETIALAHPNKYGWWTIEVEGFGYTYYQRFWLEYVVHERFDINLTAPAYVKENEFAFAGIMNANLTSGYPVKGNASVQLTVKPPDISSDYPTLTRKIPYFNGVTSFQFPMEEIRNVSSTKPGTKLEVSLHVQDYYYPGMLQAKITSEIVNSEVNIKFLGGRIRTFKPSIPFKTYIAVYESDGSPISRIFSRVLMIETLMTTMSGQTHTLPEKMVIIPDDGIVEYVITPNKNTKMMRIRLSDGDTENKVAELRASRYFTRSGHYLSISTSTDHVEFNKYMVLTIYCTTHIDKVTYIVLTGGRITSTSDIYMMSSRQKTSSISISRDMVPHSRIFIYGMLEDGEVLTDSLAFFVHGIRNNGVEVRLNKGKDFSFRTVEMTGLTDPGTVIAFSVMDYDFYSRGGNREKDANCFFTTYSVEEEYLTYNNLANTSFKHTWLLDNAKRKNVYFHSQGFAVDSNTSFPFNGLTVLTDAFLSRIPSAWICNETMGFLPCNDGISCYLKMQGCDNVWDCPDGADEMGYSMPIHIDEELDKPPSPSKLDMDGTKGERKRTARKMNPQVPNPSPNTYRGPDPTVINPHRPGGLDGMSRTWLHIDSALWGWKSHFTKPDGRIDIRVNMPIRPTTWVVGSFSLHPELGLAFNEHPARLDTTRPFYIILEGASKAIRGEQLGLQVVLFNHFQDPIEALVTLPRSKDYAFISVDERGVVSSYNPNTTQTTIQTMVLIKNNEVKMVHFPIVSLIETGKFTVTVEAYTFIGRAIASKKISMKMDGVTNIYHTPFFVDLVSQGSIIIPDLEIPVREMFWHPEHRYHLYVPGSEKTSVSVVGDVLGPGFTSWHLSLQALSVFIEGNGGDYIFNLANNLNWLKFLKHANQIQKADENKVLLGVLKDISQIMAFIGDDGGLSNRRKRSTPSLWMTSFALEALAAAVDSEWEDVMYIDINLLNKMAQWLVSKQDAKTGAFLTLEQPFDLKMTNNISDPEGNLLHLKETAYVLIGLSNSITKLTGTAQRSATLAKIFGAQYVADHFDYLSDPFDVCLATYALHVTDHKSKSNAFRKMQKIMKQGEYPYWSSVDIPPDPVEIINTVPFRKPRPMPQVHEASAIQATSYALMVYLRNNYFAEATRIMHWLQTQRRNDQFFSSGHDTIIAMKALREYGERITNRDLYNMRLRLEATSTPNWKKWVDLGRGHFHDYQTFSVPKVYGSVKASAVGTGIALLQMKTEVNVEYPWLQRVTPERSYDLEIDQLFFYGRNASNFHMSVCVRWTRTDLAPVSGATVIAIDIPTGFIVRKNRLRVSQKATNYRLKRARFTGGKVVLYLDYIPTTKQCESFSAERWYPVANVTIQHQIRVYDPFNSGLQNISLYNTYDLFHLHICQVCGSFQCPYCPFYNNSPHTQSDIFIVIFLSLSFVIYLQITSDCINNKRL